MAQHLEVLGLEARSSALDVGCGCREFLIRLVERFGVGATGIDSSAEHIAEARRRLLSRVPRPHVEFIVADAKQYPVSAGSLDFASCLGATHAFGEGPDAYRNALRRLILLVKPAGKILIADGYMKQPATAEYRQILGDSMPDEMTHARNVEIGVENGLTPLAAWTASEDEWDNFEWGYQRIVEQQAIEKPNDTALALKLSRRRAWIESYLRYGRSTLGYGTYLFRV